MKIPRPLIIDRYLFREFALSFFAVMAFCGLLILVFSIFDKFGDIMENDPPFPVIAMYFLTSLPFLLMQIVPIAAMLAVLFSVGGLARHNEIIALVTSGVRTLRIAAPILFGGALIAAGSFLANEEIVPPLQRMSVEYEMRLEGKDIFRESARKNVLARGDEHRYYLMRLYNPLQKQMIRPVVVDLFADGATLSRKIEADDAVLAKVVPEENKSVWLFTNPRSWTFDESGKVLSYESGQPTSLIDLEKELPLILAQEKTPEEMNFRELREHVSILANRGENADKYKTDLFLKVLFPLGIIIVLVIGYSYAVRSRAGTAMAIFGCGILWAFAYYGMTAVLQALGHAGTVSPYVAALLPVTTFALAAVYLLRRSSRWHA